MSWFTMSRKIRNQAPQPPAPPEEIQEVVPRRGPGRPRGSRESTAVKVLRPEVAGVRQATFPHVPVELWNKLTALTGEYLKAIAGGLEAAYSEGIELKTAQLLDETLPDAALGFGRATMEALAAQERGFHGSVIPCHVCGQNLEYQGDVDKTIKTRIGDITLKRAYYHGPCGHSVCPLDMLLGVDGVHAVMPSLQDTVAWLTASMSYPETVKLLARFCPSEFSLKAVETITATVAAQVQEAQQEEIQAVQDDPSAAARRDGELVPGVVVLETDGGFITVRDHTEPSREFKLAVLGTLEQKASSEAVAVAAPGEVDKGLRLVDKSFVGHFADPDTLYEHVATEFFRRGYHRFETVHGIGDGGCWVLPRIATLAQEWQELSLVLDWWHADERVAQAAAALHGIGTAAAATWRAGVRSALWNSKLDEFFEGLTQALAEATARKDEKCQETLQEHYDYFHARRHLLRYQECRDRGLPIGSGAIEGGIRFIGKDRLDRTGMSWNVGGAEAVLQLRCVKYSNRWDELAEKRAVESRQRYANARMAWVKAA